MKIKIFSFLLLMASFVSLVSCMKDDNKVVSYDEAAIASFTLGTLSRTYDTKTKAGKDTTVTVSYTGTSYPFYVDQQSGYIWNPDSLPYGTKINAVVCNITTVNSGIVCLMNLTRDSLVYWHSTDSVDFSYDRGVKVYSNSGKYYRDYNVHVNVCKVPKRRAEWETMPVSEQIAALNAGVRVLSVGGKMLVYGSDATATYAYSTADGKAWDALGTIGGADAWNDIVGVDGKVYMIGADGKLMRSDDGVAFDVVSDASAYGVAKLVGGSKEQIFGFSAEGGMLVSTDKGETWKADTLINEKDKAYLPDDNLNFMTMQHPINKEMTIDLLVGTSQENDDNAVVWRKIENEPAKYAGWDYIDIDDDVNIRRLPNLDKLRVVNTAGYLIAIGGIADDEGVTILKNVWVSMDNGLTWMDNTYLQLPDNFDASATTWSAAVDAEGSVWLVFGKTGQVMKVKVNGL